MELETLIDWGYIVAAILFVIGLKMLNRQDSARRGNMVSAVGMLVAVVATLLVRGMSYEWILVGVALGVPGDELELAAEDAALGVDLLDEHHGALGGRLAEQRGRAGERHGHADLDGLLRVGGGRS